ncbi:hypothetical protein CIHG_04177 [Coccidioides immitis H538.4]|uniref:Uncharacterized protein n=1 Tax=Coccidioides immitis H538.4 TaxID=396776 RepID=A0A0J8UG62_COCIT|nr:hypothetical protein CIHG_04177 [Coccidioides immitis H538.4]
MGGNLPLPAAFCHHEENFCSAQTNKVDGVSPPPQAPKYDLLVSGLECRIKSGESSNHGVHHLSELPVRSANPCIQINHRPSTVVSQSLFTNFLRLNVDELHSD